MLNNKITFTIKFKRYSAFLSYAYGSMAKLLDLKIRGKQSDSKNTVAGNCNTLCLCFNIKRQLTEWCSQLFKIV